LANHFL
jgi:hypothetical protein